MPKFREVSEEEKVQIEKRKAVLDLTPYVEYLKGKEHGKLYEAELEDGETTRVVKGRLTKAAKILGEELKYKPIKERVFFEIKPREAEAKPSRKKKS